MTPERDRGECASPTDPCNTATGGDGLTSISDDWAVGTGIALAMLECGPPTEHRAGAEMALLANGRYHLAVGSTEMGNGSVTSHRQIAAHHLRSRAGDIDIVNADTDRAPYDSGTFASTGTVVAGQAVGLCAAALRANILGFAGRHSGTDPGLWEMADDGVTAGNRRIALTDLHALGTAAGHRFQAIDPARAVSGQWHRKRRAVYYKVLLPRWMTASGFPISTKRSTTDERVAPMSV